MGREIKFRAWDEEGKKMFNIARFDFADYTVYSHLFACEGYLGEALNIMQYTGLKDKYGVEIYEGDIINVSDTFRAIVEYESPSFKLNWADVYQIRMKAKKKELAWNAHIIYEVIGNIYGNPELLNNK